MLQRTTPPRSDRGARARYPGGRRPREAPRPGGRGGARRRPNSDAAVGSRRGSSRDAACTPTRVPGASRRSWPGRVVELVDIRDPVLGLYENPNAIDTKANRHDQYLQNATGPSPTAPAGQVHAGATLPPVPGPPAAPTVASSSPEKRSGRPREVGGGARARSQRTTPLRAGRHSGVVRCGAGRPREIRTAAPCTDPQAPAEAPARDARRPPHSDDAASHGGRDWFPVLRRSRTCACGFARRFGVREYIWIFSHTKSRSRNHLGGSGARAAGRPTRRRASIYEGGKRGKVRPVRQTAPDPRRTIPMALLASGGLGPSRAQRKWCSESLWLPRRRGRPRPERATGRPSVPYHQGHFMAVPYAARAATCAPRNGGSCWVVSLLRAPRTVPSVPCRRCVGGRPAAPRAMCPWATPDGLCGRLAAGYTYHCSIWG